MATDKLIGTMETLLKLHKSLYETAVKKTEIVKIGDIDALNQTLKDEQTHIAAINKFEKERQKFASIIVPGVDKPNIQDCIDCLENGPREKLTQLRSELLDVINQISKRNNLNQKMLFQSLQFVNFSLNLFFPQEENMNYSAKVEKESLTGQSTRLFNFKA